MAKIKNDPSNTLLVVGNTDGSITRAVSIYEVNNMLTRIELQIRLSGA